MSTRPLLFALATALAMSLSASNAQACDGGGYGYGYGCGIGQLYNSLEFRVPYFAAHPPVYYSQPVPRTYGHSPFAYPPHFRTPDVVFEIQPLQVSNPFVPKSKVNKAADEPTERTVSHPVSGEAAAPQVIENPFVKNGRLVSLGG